jgi:hypothetical protein
MISKINMRIHIFTEGVWIQACIVRVLREYEYVSTY